MMRAALAAPLAGAVVALLILAALRFVNPTS
jgi:hypothetical protein